MGQSGRIGVPSYVSRGGLKLAAALDHFRVDPAACVCADLGSNVGGFVDVLLQRGAQRVYSIDTSYGTLAWKLRRDPRVVALERTNALFVQLGEPVRLVTIDVGWTRQGKILPSAARLLEREGFILSLVKPHYEAPRRLLQQGVLPKERFAEVCDQVIAKIGELNLELIDRFESPLLGQAGNRELWLLLRQ